MLRECIVIKCIGLNRIKFITVANFCVIDAERSVFIYFDFCEILKSFFFLLLSCMQI